MLPSKTDPMKVSQEIGSKVNIRFGHALKCCLQKGTILELSDAAVVFLKILIILVRCVLSGLELNSA